MKTLSFLASLLCLGAAIAAEPASIIDSCSYTDDKAAQANWIAGEGSSPAAVRMVDGKPALLLRCAFGSSEIGRGVWDRKVTLDLSGAQGVELEMMCTNAGPISAFSLYFQSGKGWFHSSFSPRYAEGWNRIVISKAEMKEDSNPESWSQLTRLRIAAWRGDGQDTEFLIRNVRPIGLLGGDAHVLLLEGGNGPDVKATDRKTIAENAERISRMLTAQGIRHASVHDDVVTADMLKLATVVVLPFNPGMPKTTVEALKTYLEGSGKVIAFYSLPSVLSKVTSIKPGSWQPQANAGQLAAIRPVNGGLPGAPAEAKQHSWAITTASPLDERAHVVAEWFDDQGKSTGLPAIIASNNAIMMTHIALDDDRAGHERLLLAMVGALDAKVWQGAVEARRDRIAGIGAARTVEAVVAGLESIANTNAEVRSNLDAAKQKLAAADSKDYAVAFDATVAAERLLREAWCMAQPAKEGEFRAFWCHSALGVKGKTWDESIAQLKRNGFTAIMPNMLWGGVAYYPSKVLPVAKDVKEKGDQVAACVAACKKHGVQIHVWKVDWNLGHDVPKAFVDQMRSEGRLQSSWDGVEQPWLCPSNPQNVAMEREALVEVARNYPIDGIHFDYIRYPGQDHCFCKPCRERFEKATGKPVAQWPKDVQPKGIRRDEWVAFCQNNITTLVETTSKAVREVRPGIKVSAAVFRNWAVDSKIVMQDWKLWCERGYLDFVCPMDYTTNNGTYDSWVRNQKTWAGPAELVPGIGASSTNVSQTADQVIGQINITRKYGCKGFIIFNLGTTECDELVPMLGLGATKVK